MLELHVHVIQVEPLVHFSLLTRIQALIFKSQDLDTYPTLIKLSVSQFLILIYMNQVIANQINSNIELVLTVPKEQLIALNVSLMRMFLFRLFVQIVIQATQFKLKME